MNFRPLVRALSLTLVLLIVCGMPVSSQQPATAGSAGGYNIELVIFRAGSASGGGENWSSEAGSRGITSGDEAASGGAQLGRFIASLPSSQFQLSDVASKLKSTGVYVPIAHVAWTQTASAWGTRGGFPVQRVGLNVDGLSGTVSLERGQYLHLGLALNYAMPNPPSGAGAAPGTMFTLKESRRVRFYERNYYDHPAFGVIALVTPAQGSRAPGR